MRLPGFAWFPAHPTNQTPGRERPIRAFTAHHSAGWEQTLRHLWADPDRNGSSTLYVSGTVREQYVELENTPWTNSNWVSNTESITCETRGDWRGYFDQATLNNLREAMYQALKFYPNLILQYHCDVTDKTRPTICPCDLKNKAYAAQMWQEAKNRISVENAPKPLPVNLRLDIPDKKVILIRDSNIWDMTFTSFANAKSLGSLPKGTVLDVAGVYDHPLSKTDYYLSNYSWNKGLNNGINRADCQDYTVPAPVPEPPVPNPAPTPVPNPTPKPPEESPGTKPPLPVDPNGDIIKRLTALEALVAKIADFLANLPGFKK